MPILQERRKKADELVQENARKKSIKDRGLIKEWDIESVASTSGIPEKELQALLLAPSNAR